MAARQPTDTCLLCNDSTKKATQRNSHIVPAALLKSNIGKRGKELSYLIDSSKPSIDEYYGRDHPDNPSTEIKQNHHTRDYYFCPDCEKKLGVLEGKVTPHLTEKLRDEKLSGNYQTFNSDGLSGKELLKVDSHDLNVLFLSVVWRMALEHQIENNLPSLSPDELEKIRRIIHSYLSGDAELYNDLCDKFATQIFTAEGFFEVSENLKNGTDKLNTATANLVAVADWKKKPYVFFVNEFLVMLYSEEDLIVVIDNPNSQFELPPHPKLLNLPGIVPKIIFLPKKEWYDFTRRWLEDFAKIYANSQARKFRKPTRTTKRRQKTRKSKQRKRQAMRTRRALKSRKRR